MLETNKSESYILFLPLEYLLPKICTLQTALPTINPPALCFAVHFAATSKWPRLGKVTQERVWVRCISESWAVFWHLLLVLYLRVYTHAEEAWGEHWGAEHKFHHTPWHHGITSNSLSWAINLLSQKEGKKVFLLQRRWGFNVKSSAGYGVSIRQALAATERPQAKGLLLRFLAKGREPVRFFHSCASAPKKLTHHKEISKS